MAESAGDSIIRVAKVLTKASLEKGVSQPFTRVTYPEQLDRACLQIPEQLLSLRHHALYSTLSDEQKWTLSLHEAINFFSVNIHGERALVRDLVARLYARTPLGDPRMVGEYLQHFIHEENSHTFMLAQYCNRYGDGVGKDFALSVSQDAELSPEGHELLSFGRTFVLESFLDFMNQAVMTDDTLDGTARQIHRFHHIDEARHMAFDRAVVETMAQRMLAEGKEQEVRQIGAQLVAYGELSFSRMSNPLVYRRLGLANPTQLSWEVAALPERQALGRKWLAAARLFLGRVGIVPADPAVS
ncbi:MAG: diiron oxygenase [Pseudomonadota bacterium]